jgi:hypothetical protein
LARRFNFNFNSNNFTAFVFCDVQQVDVGANFYYYPGGNDYRGKDPSKDPKYGPQWGKGLSGGLPAQVSRHTI